MIRLYTKIHKLDQILMSSFLFDFTMIKDDNFICHGHCG